MTTESTNRYDMLGPPCEKALPIWKRDMTKKRNGLKNGPENGPNAFVDLSQGHGLNIYFVIIILIYFYL